MDWLHYLTDGFACMIESYCFFKLMTSQCGFREDRYGNWQKIVWILAAIVLYGNNLSGKWGDENIVGTILFFSGYILYSIFFVEKSIGYKLVVGMMGAFILTFIDSVVVIGYILYDGNVEDIAERLWEPVLRSQLTILSKCIVLLVMGIYMLIQHGKKSRDVLKWEITPVYMGVLVLLWLALLTTGASVTSYQYYFFEIAYCIVMIFIVLFLVYLISRMERLNDEKLEYQMSLQQQNMEQQHYREGKKLYNSLREMRHDMKHHVAYMDYLLAGKEYDKLAEYIEQLGE